MNRSSRATLCAALALLACPASLILPAPAVSASPVAHPDSILADGAWSDAFVAPGPYGGGIGGITTIDGKLHLTGSMTMMDGDPVGNIAVWDGERWVSPYPDFPSGSVRVLRKFQDRLWVGIFASTGNPALYTLSSGTWDAVYVDSPPGDYLVARNLVPDGDDLLFVGETITTRREGNFSYFDTYRGFIQRYDGENWSAMDSGLVEDEGAPILVRHQGELYAAGAFTGAVTDSAIHLGLWDGARWGLVDEGLHGDVLRYKTWGEFIVAAGSEIAVDGEDSLTALAVWDGNRWSALRAPGFIQPERIWGLQSNQAGDLYILGSFQEYSTACAQWTAEGWQILTDGLDLIGASLRMYEGKPLLTGYMTLMGRRGDNLAVWEGSRWQPIKPWPTWLAGPMVALTAGPEGVYAAGEFSVPNSPQALSGVGLWDGSGWTFLGEAMDKPPRCLVRFDGGLVAGGVISRTGDQIVNNVAWYDGTAWRPLGEGLDGWVKDLIVYNGDLIACGYFELTGAGVRVNRVARWNGTRWSPLGSGVRGSSVALANSMAVYRDKLVVGGNFDWAGEGRVTKVAQWDGKQWSAVGSLEFDNISWDRIDEVAVAHDRLYASAAFGISRNGEYLGHLAVWDGQQWSAVDTSLSSGPFIESHENRLVVADDFLEWEGRRTNVLEWDGHQWLYPGRIWSGSESVYRGPAVTALATWQGDLYVSGRFQAAGDLVSYNFAHWRPFETQPDPGRQQLRVYPNPSRSPVFLSFDKIDPGPLRVAIYDVQGRLVRELSDTQVHTTEATYFWDLRDSEGARVSAGVYFARGSGAGSSSTRKIIVAP